MALVKKILQDICKAEMVSQCSDFPSVPTAKDGRHEWIYNARKKNLKEENFHLFFIQGASGSEHCCLMRSCLFSSFFLFLLILFFEVNRGNQLEWLELLNQQNIVFDAHKLFGRGDWMTGFFKGP